MKKTNKILGASLLGLAAAMGGVSTSMAADVAVTSTTSTDATNLATTNDPVYATDGAYGSVLTGGATTIALDVVTVTESGTLYFEDDNGGGDLTMASIAVSTDKTFTILLGAEDDGTEGTKNPVASVLGAVTGGGSIAVNAWDNGVATNSGGAGTIEFAGAMTLSALTIESGDGGAANAGATLTVTDIGTGSDALAITTMTLQAGDGSDANKAGGLLTITEMAGDITGTTYTIVGGQGGDSGSGAGGGAGGEVQVDLHAGDITSVTTVNLGSGAGGAGAGNATAAGIGGVLDINAWGGAVVAATTMNVYTGNGGAGGAGADGGAGGASEIVDIGNAGIAVTTLNVYTGNGGDGLVNVAAGDGGNGGAHAITDLGAITATTMNIYSGNAGTAGAGTTAAGGDSGQGGALVITDLAAANAITNFNVTAGNGADAGATTLGVGGLGAVGGALTISDIGGGLTTTTMIVTAGNGGAAATGTAVSTGATGGNGGDVNIDAIAGHIAATVAATGATVTVTAGNGGAGGAANGGQGGVAGTGGDVNFDSTGTIDASTLSIVGGNGGDGGDGTTAHTATAGGRGGNNAADFTGASVATTLNVTGGNAGNGGTGVLGTGLTGGAAGTAAATFASTLNGQASATTATTITVQGGTGGNGGNSTGVGTGATGVAGGAATLTLNDVTYASTTLNDGTAGSAGTASSSGTAGAAGAGGDAILATAAALTYVGDILSASDDEGTINQAGGLLTLQGNIGTSASNEIKMVNLGQAAGLTITGNIYAEEIDMDSEGADLIFNGTTAQIVSGVIYTSGNGTELLQNSNTTSTVTFNSGVGRTAAGVADPLVTMTLDTGSSTIFGSTVDSATLTGTTTAIMSFEDTVTLSGALEVGAAGTITLTSGIVAGETAIVQANGGGSLTTSATVNMPATFTTGTITLIDNTTTGTNQGAVDAALITFGSNTLATFVAAGSADLDSVTVTATAKSGSVIAAALGMDTSSGNAAVAAAAGLTGTALTNYNAALVTGGQTAIDAVNKARPDGGAAGASAAAGGAAVGGSISGRQSSLLANSNHFGLKKYSSETGVSSGGSSLNNGFWVQAFGSDADMDMRDKVAGYDANVYGVTVGVDGQMADNIVAGFALSYANIDVDGKSAANSQTDTDQFQGTLYGTMMMDNFYVNGTLAYAYADNDSVRTTNANLTANGDYDTDTFSASIGAGMPMDMGTFSLTPQANLTYAHINTEAYTETGNSVLTVDTDNMNVVHLIAGVSMNTKIEQSEGTLVPNLRLMADWDITQEESESDSNYAGAASFKTLGAEPAALGGIAGLGLDYNTNDGLYNVSVGYDASFREDYVSHAGSVKVRYNF